MSTLEITPRDRSIPVEELAKMEGCYWNPLDFTMEEWVILRRGWGNPNLDRRYWNQVRLERESSAAHQSFVEATGQDPIL